MGSTFWPFFLWPIILLHYIHSFQGLSDMHEYLLKQMDSRAFLGDKQHIVCSTLSFLTPEKPFKVLFKEVSLTSRIIDMFILSYLQQDLGILSAPAIFPEI